MEQDLCPRELTAAVVVCTRPAQDQASQRSQMGWDGAPELKGGAMD